MRRPTWFVIVALIGVSSAGCDKAIEAIEKAEDEVVAREMARVEKHVIDDFVKQYEIVARSGSAMERCLQAGMVAGAYLQAKDEENFVKWKEKEKSDCAEAGMPDL